MTIDECKSASQAWQDQKLALLMQRNPLGVIEWNNQFKVVEWNLAAEQMFGYSQAEVIGHHAAGLIVPESARAHVDQVMQALLHQQGGACSINENFTKDGKTIVCEWYNTPLIDAEGHVLGVMSMVQDITDRQQTELKLKQAKQDLEIKVNEKTATLNQTISQLRQEIREHKATLEEHKRMEAALNQSQKTYQALLSAMPDVVLRLDAEEICLDYMLTKSFRSTAIEAEWRGKPLTELMPAHLAERRSYYIQRALKTGEVQCYEQEIELEGTVQTEEVRIAVCGDREVLVIIRDVSERARIEAERKTAEQQVQEVQEFLHSILNSIPDPIFVKNSDHQWVLINEAFCNLMGQPRTALIGKSDYDVLPEEQADKVWEKDHFVLTTNAIEINEEYITDKDGELRIISTKKTSVVDTHGDRFLIGSIRDITSYHDVLEALRQSEERFQRLATNIPGIIYQFRLTPDGQFAFPYVSAFSEKLWELDPELVEHDANLALNQLHPDDRDSFLAGITSSAKALHPWEWLGRMITASGKLKWVQGHSRPELQVDGSIVWDGLMVDVSDRVRAEDERKRTEAAIAESEARFRSFVENANDLIYSLSIEGTFTYLSPKLTEMAGYAPSELVGKPFSWSTYAEDVPIVQAFLQHMLTTRKQQAGLEFRAIRKDGSLYWLTCNVSPIQGSNGSIISLLCIARDISDRKAAEEALRRSEAQLRQQALDLEHALGELQRTQAQLIQTEKMSSLGQLVAGVAHEINNPISFIYGNLRHAKDYFNDLLTLIEMYQQHYPQSSSVIRSYINEIDLDFLSSDLSKLLESMRVGADRIRQIVASLRTFARLDEAEFKAINIHEGLESTLTVLQSRLNKDLNGNKIQVVKEYSTLPLVECYAGDLNQALFNLLNNAIDSLEEVAKLQKSEGIFQLKISTKLIDQQGIQICITDNGLGVAEKDQPRLFDPFFTTKPVGAGTGLGLSTSYQIITKQHKGSLRCISTPNQGATFVLEIPLHQRPLSHRS